MEAMWFVQQAGKIYGPFDSLRLKKLAAAGKIAVDSGIAKDKAGPWTAASRVRGLFSNTQQASGEGVADAVDDDRTTAVVKRRWFRLAARRDRRVESDDSTTPMWYLRGDDNAPVGPFGSADVAKLVGRGAIQPSTFVLKHGTARWETAFSAGLFLDDPADDKAATGSPFDAPAVSADGTTAAEHVPERVLWKGQASHHVNYGTYFLCALGAPLYFPAKWGIQRFRERNAVRYVITSRKVRVESGADHKQQTEIPLTRIGKVKLDTPPALEGTRACNISLFAADESLLTILEGVPLDEAARVISLCESAIHHQLKVDASARVLAHQRVEDEKARRRIESQRKWALAGATMRAGAAEHRARELREQVRRLKTVLGDDCPEDVIERSLAAYSACPPYQPRSGSSGGGWFGWLGGGRKKATWVRGFYRNGKWVKPHKRRKR